MSGKGGGRFVTRAGIVVLVEESRAIPLVDVSAVLRTGSLAVRLDDGRTTELPRALTSSNRLAHAYAITVHRSQGATVDTAHYLEDGGGRELAYVALSRARLRGTVYARADELSQAVEDLSIAWTSERRQEWVIDRHQIQEPSGRSVDDGMGLDLW